MYTVLSTDLAGTKEWKKQKEPKNKYDNEGLEAHRHEDSIVGNNEATFMLQEWNSMSLHSGTTTS